MSAFYRNLLDQTTDNVIKTEPTQSEDTRDGYESHMRFIHATCCDSTYCTFSNISFEDI